MIADYETSLCSFIRDMWLEEYVLSEKEECCRSFLRLENIHQLFCNFKAWSVVEGERYFFCSRAAVVIEIRVCRIFISNDRSFLFASEKEQRKTNDTSNKKCRTCDYRNSKIGLAAFGAV